MPTNSWMFLVAALIPMIVGAIWYSPKVFGTKWMKINGFTEEGLSKGNMPLIFGLAYFFSIVLGLGLSGMVNHQTSVYQLMVPEVQVAGSSAETMFKELMATFGNHHRNWGHGALHGGMAAILTALPLIAINSLFERRGAAYILIHFGYWFVTLTAMGALLCATLVYPSV